MPAAKSKLSAREKARIAAREKRLAKARWRELLMELIVCGHSYHAAAKEMRVSVATVRREINRMIAKREIETPESFVHLQVARLQKALGAIYYAMDEGDLGAVAPLLRVVAELDRYHGLLARVVRPPDPGATPLDPPPRLALGNTSAPTEFVTKTGA